MPCPYDQVRGHGLTYAPTDATVGGELVLGTGVQGREDARKPSHPCERGAGFLLELTGGRRRKFFHCVRSILVWRCV
jgi:hypothetical protein